MYGATNHTLSLPPLNSKTFNIACKFLLDTSAIHGNITPTFTRRDSHTNETDDQQDLTEYADKVMQQFVESQPSSLMKLCILGIRQHMPDRREEDFDRLQLPAVLKSYVTFGHLARDLQQLEKE